MNRTLLFAGGTVLVAGGLAYWYLAQRPVPPIPPPPNGHECYGDCFYEGATDCDRQGNLCKCVNEKWQLLEQNSPVCESGIYHKECFPSQNNIVTCIPVPGIGADKCTELGFSTGCSCSPPQLKCDDFHACEFQDNTCVLKAVSYPISATSENMYCFDSGGASYCNYWLDEPVAALNLIGELFYKWGPFPCEWADFGIFAYYKGRWKTLKEGTPWVCGTEGSMQIATHFAAQGIEMIQFGIDALVSNIHIDKFIGHLSY